MQISGIFKTGFRAAVGKAKQAFKPIMKTFDFSNEEMTSYLSHETLIPTGHDFMDSADPEADDALDLDSFTAAVEALESGPISGCLLEDLSYSDGFYERKLDHLDSISGTITHEL